jgi:serine/threonine protein kinase
LSDRYRVVREIGRGGMATVYLADDQKHHRQVAIKVIDAEFAELLGKDRFLREIESRRPDRSTHPAAPLDEALRIVKGVAEALAFLDSADRWPADSSERHVSRWQGVRNA